MFAALLSPKPAAQNSYCRLLYKVAFFFGDVEYRSARLCLHKILVLGTRVSRQLCIVLVSATQTFSFPISSATILCSIRSFVLFLEKRISSNVKSSVRNRMPRNLTPLGNFICDEGLRAFCRNARLRTRMVRAFFNRLLPCSTDYCLLWFGLSSRCATGRFMKSLRGTKMHQEQRLHAMFCPYLSSSTFFPGPFLLSFYQIDALRTLSLLTQCRTPGVSVMRMWRPLRNYLICSATQLTYTTLSRGKSLK